MSPRSLYILLLVLAELKIMIVIQVSMIQVVTILIDAWNAMEGHEILFVIGCKPSAIKGPTHINSMILFQTLRKC